MQRVPLQVSDDRVVGVVQGDLTEQLLEGLRHDLLDGLSSSKASGVILDLSGVEVMDLVDFNGLQHLIAMASLMGTYTVLTGMRPGVVAALVELGADVDGVRAARDMESAVELLAELSAGRVEDDSGRAPDHDGGVW